MDVVYCRQPESHPLFTGLPQYSRWIRAAVLAAGIGDFHGHWRGCRCLVPEGCQSSSRGAGPVGETGYCDEAGVSALRCVFDVNSLWNEWHKDSGLALMGVWMCMDMGSIWWELKINDGCGFVFDNDGI